MWPWCLIAVEFRGVSSQIGSIMTTKNEVYAHSEEASACSTALRTSSSSYSGLAMHKLVHRKRKELMTAPKLTFSGKAEQYIIPPIMEQLRRLPNSFVVVRNLLSSACCVVDGIAQRLASLSWRPCGLWDLARGG